MLVPYDDRVTGVDLDRRRAAGRAGLADHRRRRHAPRDAAVRARHRAPPRRSRTAPTKDARRPPEHPRDRVHDRRLRPGRDAGRAAADLGLHVRGRVLRRRGQRRTGRRRASSTSRSSPTSTTCSASPPARPSRWATTTASRARWIAADNGIVIKIVGESGGRAQLDVDRRRRRRHRAHRARHRRRRAGQARRALRPRQEPLARRDHALHAVGLQLALRPARRRRRPRPGRPRRRRPDGDDPCNASGSIILCENQVLGEQLADRRHAVHARLPVRPRPRPPHGRHARRSR